MIELRGYIDERGNKPFEAWFNKLDPHAAAKIAIALARMEQSNLANTKGVGANTKSISGRVTASTSARPASVS